MGTDKCFKPILNTVWETDLFAKQDKNSHHDGKTLAQRARTKTYVLWHFEHSIVVASE